MTPHEPSRLPSSTSTYSTWPRPPPATDPVELVEQRRQALGLVVDRNDDADHVHGHGLIRPARGTAEEAAAGDAPARRPRRRASSPRTQVSRKASAAITAVSAPSAGVKAVIKTPSRTPRPPGITATANPATVASATPPIDRRPEPDRHARRCDRPDDGHLAQAEQDPAGQRPEQPLSQQSARDRRQRVGTDSRKRHADQPRHPGKDQGIDQRPGTPTPSPPPSAAAQPCAGGTANPSAAISPPAAIMTSVS